MHRVLEFNQSQWLRLKTYVQNNNSAMYRKTMKNLRNRNNVKLLNNEKDYLKCTSKPSYMSHKIFDNNLLAIRKSKIK